jgi:hypothetical protein
LDNTSETVRAVTATTTLTNNDYVVLCDPAGGAITVNLPAVATVQPGRTYWIRSTGTTNAVTIDGSGAETIDGGATKSLASAAVHAVKIVSDGTAWFTVSSF